MTSNKQGPKPEIVCKEDGPYIVSNVRQMTDTSGETMPTQTVMALCRCGKSGKKPFCDGSHVKAGFSSKNDIKRKTANREDTYTGEHIRIHDNRGLCAHAGICTSKLPSVFRMKAEPWIDPEQTTAQEIKAVIDSCPSGALSYSIEGEHQSAQTRETLIKVLPGGPYEIIGDIELSEVNLLEGASKNARTLCRCGHSNNKPFCDGSHWSVGFKDA